LASLSIRDLVLSLQLEMPANRSMQLRRDRAIAPLCLCRQRLVEVGLEVDGGLDAVAVPTPPA